MSKIALVYPIGSKEVTLPPHGIAYLSSYLKQHGYSVDLFDFNVEMMTIAMNNSYEKQFSEVIEKLKTHEFYNVSVLEEFNYYFNQNFSIIQREIQKLINNFSLTELQKNSSCKISRYLVAKVLELTQYEIVGLSVIFRAQIESAYIIASLLKEYNPKVKIIVGGISASNIKNIFSSTKVNIDNFKDIIDTVIYGDGEQPLLEYIQNQHKSDTDASDFNYCKDLNTLPPPDFQQLFQKYNYVAPHKILPLAITRGCYWSKCIFCAYGWVDYKSGKATAGYRKCSTDKILADIKYLKKANESRHFYFTVDVVDPLLINQLAEKLIEESVDIYWRAEIRAEKTFLNSEVLDKLYKSGCRTISFGMESVVQKVLDIMQKGSKADDNKNLVNLLNKSGIGINVDFMTGFPGETPEDMIETVNFIFQNSHKILQHSPGHSFKPVNQSQIMKSSQYADLLTYNPETKEVTKKGMSFDEQSRQEHIVMSNMFLDNKIIRFPFTNDGAFFFLYCCHFSLDKLPKIIQTNKGIYGIGQQTEKLFSLTFSYIKRITDALPTNAFFQIWSKEKILFDSTDKTENLNMHYNFAKKIIAEYKFSEELEQFLLEVLKVDYYRVLSCLNKDEIPCMKTSSNNNLPEEYNYVSNKETDTFKEEFSINVLQVLSLTPFEHVRKNISCNVMFDINGVQIIEPTLN